MSKRKIALLVFGYLALHAAAFAAVTAKYHEHKQNAGATASR
jgi:hypothetical protein